MSIIYDWLNPNKEAITKIEVYRANKRGGAKTLLATVAPTTLAYEDNTAQINKVYFYSSLVYQDDLKTWSVEQPLASFDSTGPGSSKLLRGNWEFGYFGSVDKSLMPTFSEVATAAGISTDSTAMTALKVFHKWIVGGRIIFIPDTPFASSNLTFTGNVLMQKKLMPTVGQTDKDLFSFSKNGLKYIIRAPYMDDRESAIGDGSLVIGSASVQGHNGSYPVSELMALLCCFSGADTAKRLKMSMWYADSVMPDATNFATYLWSSSFVSLGAGDPGDSSRPMVYIPYLNQINTSTPAFGRGFWPIFILDLSV